MLKEETVGKQNTGVNQWFVCVERQNETEEEGCKCV